MCGICFLIQPVVPGGSGENDAFAGVFDELKAMNAARGPDGQDTVRTQAGNVQLTFFGSELRLRGREEISQPHRDDEGNLLCWNGEIFEGIDVSPEENDGAKLFALLSKSLTVDDVLDILGSIEGPYGIVYYHHTLRKLFFGRDPLGRRSLLVHWPTVEHPRFLLTSVSIGVNAAYSLDELPTECIYGLDVDPLGYSSDFTARFEACLQRLPRQNPGSTRRYAELPRVNTELPDDTPLATDLSCIPEHLTDAVNQFIEHLDRSVRLRVSTIPQHESTKGKARVAVLFSGGIDSTMLTYLAHRHVPLDEPIDLLNVAFENPRKILVQTDGNIGGMPKRQKKQKLREPTDYSTIAVDYNVPDRLTGLQELEELRRLCPGRIWNFVEIDVPYDEYQSRRQIVEDLMFPRRTVMDLSLAMALFFAAQGHGKVRASREGQAEPYSSTARVLLNGLGSDELLGGYGRFRTAFKHHGWEAIVKELQLELDRIPTRNLGRDDRVISFHGKETRHPFLSLSVVSFLVQLPVHMKLDPRLEAGFGEKMLLRLAAYKVGLVEASARKKRAMQFGSHSARMSPGQDEKKGTLRLADFPDGE